MEVYLDNSATTKCFPEVVEVINRMMRNEYGNPSSMHLKGLEAEKNIRQATKTIAGILKVNEKEIIYTSGGTESDNLAIIGTAMAYNRSGKHMITTAIEHAAVLSCMKFLETQGFEITYLKTDSEGRISLKELEEAIREDTILVSIMGVNNEIGTIEPIEEAGRIIKERNPKTLFHVDAVQMFGKMNLYPKRMKIDFLAVSGHKIHGPKGVGFLYVNESARIRPVILGGGQQKGMRSGTENVPGIMGLAKACEMVYATLSEDVERMYGQREYFIRKISQLEGITINGAKEKTAPHIVSVSVKGVRAEVLLHALEEKGVYVSAGSACSSNKPAVSETLKAIGVDKDLLDATVRFSFSTYTTNEEIDYAIKAVGDVIGILRRFVRR